jgi:glycosyltransferase involved in cell wall biosynthesis
MKILVVCQHYWPEPYPLRDVCEELVARGHQVDLVTGVPNYPLGYIYPEYRKGKNRHQVHNGVRIHRTFTIGRRNNIFFRMLNYFSFAISSTLYVCRMKETFDVVFANQTSPVIMSCGALVYGKKRGKKVVLYSMDIWPACLAVGGIQKNSIIYKIFHRISGLVYRKADRILVSSEMFRGYMREEFGIEDRRIAYNPQYAEPLFKQSRTIEKETVDLLFAGNIGVAQSLPTILGAAELLQDQKQVRWHIVGDGSELAASKELAKSKNLTNVIFHGRKPQEQMPEYYAMADAMLITLSADPLVSMTLPGKMQSYMAVGKPIIGAANGEIPRTIEKSACGLCAPAESVEDLAAAVRAFLEHPNKALMGENARKYYLENFSRERFMDAVERELMEHAQ